MTSSNIFDRMPVHDKQSEAHNLDHESASPDADSRAIPAHAVAPISSNSPLLSSACSSPWPHILKPVTPKDVEDRQWNTRIHV